MAEFLNRTQIVEEIIKVINGAKKEIVMVVPFIKISPTIWSELSKQETLSKEILLVYREDSMKDSERTKLHSLPNLTIMNHPNVHAKCYLNEEDMIICSMNLYEHSEKNNREMGVILRKSAWDSTTFQDGVKEIRTILNASRLEKKSIHVQENGFSFGIFDTGEEWLREYVSKINKVFVHKKFELWMDGHAPEISCFPYHENVKVSVDYEKEGVDQSTTMKIRRFALGFQHPDESLLRLHSLFWKQFNASDFEHYKIYWDYYKSQLTIYAERRKYPQWNSLNFEQSLVKFRQGLDLLVDYIKKVERRVL